MLPTLTHFALISSSSVEAGFALPSLHVVPALKLHWGCWRDEESEFRRYFDATGGVDLAIGLHCCGAFTDIGAWAGC